MGGAMGLGNWQPAAEFNIYVDPQAAEIVFQSGIPVVMAGLDVTHKAQILPPISSDSARLATRCRPSSPSCSTSLWPTTRMKMGL
jgi:inosine-uridine nucleoside N-ribohydrolase